MFEMPPLQVKEMSKNINVKFIAKKKFVLYREYPTQRGARQAAAIVRREVPDKGYLVRVVRSHHWYFDEQGKQHWWGVYVHDGVKKPWRT